MNRFFQETNSRVTAVLTTAAEETDWLGRVPTNDRELENFLDRADETGDIQLDALMQVKALEKRYRDIIRSRTHRVSVQERRALESTVQLQHSIVLQLLKEDQYLASHLASEPKNAQIAQFADTLRSLENIIKRRLGVTRQQQTAADIEMMNKQSRIEDAEKRLENSERKLEEQKELWDKHLTDLDNTMRRIKDELTALTASAQTELADVEAAGATRLNTINVNHDKANSALKTQLEKLRNEKKALLEAHQEEEAAMRKKKSRMILALADQVNQYDESQRSLNEEIVKLRAEIEADEGTLEELRNYFAKVEETQDTISKNLTEFYNIKKNERLSELRTNIQARAILKFIKTGVDHKKKKKPSGKGDGGDKTKKKAK